MNRGGAVGTNQRSIWKSSACLLVCVLCWALSACEPKPASVGGEETVGLRNLTAIDLIDRPLWEEVLQAYPHPDIWEPEVLSQAQQVALRSLKAPQFATVDPELTHLQDARPELRTLTVFGVDCLVFRFEKDGLQIALPLPLKVDSPVYFSGTTKEEFLPLTDRNGREWQAAKGIIQQMAAEMYQAVNRKELGAGEEESSGASR